MRKVIPIVIGLLTIATSCAKEIELFIFAGQSNAQGFKGDARFYPKDTEGLDKTIPFYWVFPDQSSSEGKWATLKAQGGRYKTGHFGPEVTFARSLKKAGQNVAFFKYSKPGTSIAGDWKLPGQGGMYDDMVKELGKAIKLLEGSGDKVKVAGFVWIQGESDARNPKSAGAFKERLKTIIGDMRKNVIKNPKLSIILGVDEQHPWVKNKNKGPAVLVAHHELAKEDEDIIFTSMLGLEKAKSDATHLSPKGLIEHGKRLYEGYKELLKVKK